MTRALLEQALEALECAYSENYDGAKIHGAKVAIRAHLAQPSWQDAPTVPGDWVIVGKGFKSELQTSITQQEIDRGSSWPGRWYGPIPPDQSPPAQTRHGPGAADRAHPAGVTPPGHSFIDFYFDFDKLSKST